MDYLLNLAYSNFFITIALFVLSLFLTIFLTTRNPYKTGAAKSAFKLLCAIPIMLVLLPPMFFSLGFSKGFDSIRQTDKHLILVENRTSGTRIHKTRRTRFYVIDKNTGQKLAQHNVNGKTSICFRQGDTLLLENDEDFTLIRLPDFKSIEEINEKNLVKKFEKLNAGIERIYNNTGDYKSIKVASKDGRVYEYFPIGDSLRTMRALGDGNKSDKLSKETYSFQRDRIIIKAGDKQDKMVYKLKGRPASLYLNDSIIRSEAFLEAEFLDFDTLSREMVISYFTSTDKDDFVLLKLDKNFKELWKIEQATSGLSDFFSSKEDEMNFFTWDDHNYYFNSGGFVACVDKKSGKLNWKCRM